MGDYVCPSVVGEFRSMARQGVRWLYAGQQDRSLVVRYLHLTYAARDLEHAVEMACRYGQPRVVEGVSLDDALASARAGQDAAQRELIERLEGRGALARGLLGTR